MNKAFQAMADRMAQKYRIIKMSVDNYENKRECPYYSELKGMEQALDTMGIDHNVIWNENCEIIGVTVCGCTAMIEKEGNT